MRVLTPNQVKLAITLYVGFAFGVTSVIGVTVHEVSMFFKSLPKSGSGR